MTFQYITSQRGKQLLIYNNYSHRQDRRNENKIIWRCNENQNCPGRVHSLDNDILKYVDHSHLSDVAKIQARKTVEEIKTLAKENSLTTRAIIGEGSSQVSSAMSRGYYNGGYNHSCEVDQHRYEEIPDIDPSMDFLQADDTSTSFYYMESPTRIRRPSDTADPAERTLLLRAQQHNHYQQLQQLQMNGCPPPLPATRARRNTPPSAAGGDRSVAAVTPCKARRRLDVYGDESGTVSLPSTPSGGRTADVFAPMMAQTAAAGAAFRPVTVRRARSSAALYNKHKRPPEFLSEYNLDTCVPATGVQYDRPRNTAVIQPIYKAPLPSVFQVEEKTTPYQAESPAKPSWSRTPPARTPVQTLPVCTLWSAAMVLVVSGTASCMLCFYLMSRRGRLYYLNAGLLAAAVCLVLGFPGFRSQQWRWLPNRNYVTGYILVAMFSALETCALWLMCQSTVLDPALNDIGAGVVCGISALSVTLACLGVSTSYCCRYPPPDNRVAHGVEGFVV